jgi:hypothetical protein
VICESWVCTATSWAKPSPIGFARLPRTAWPMRSIKQLCQLFAFGIDATSALALSTNPAVREKLRGLIAGADDTIKQLRTVIFDMAHPPGGD